MPPNASFIMYFARSISGAAKEEYLQTFRQDDDARRLKRDICLEMLAGIFLLHIERRTGFAREKPHRYRPTAIFAFICSIADMSLYLR